MAKEANRDELLTIAHAAHAADVSPATLYRWHAAGRLAIYKRGARSFVRRVDLDKATRPTRVPAPPRQVSTAARGGRT